MSFFGKKSGNAVTAAPGSAEESAQLKARVAELEAELEKLQVKLKRSDSGELETKDKRRSSVAKLETLQESSDEQTQKYIKSQFLSANALDAGGGDGSALDKLRKGGNAVLAAGRFRASGADAHDDSFNSSANGAKGGAAGPSAGSPINLRSSHPAAKVVPPRHMPEAPTDAQLDVVLQVKTAIDAADWGADVLPLCAILRKPMAYVVTLLLRYWGAADLLSVDEATITLMLEELEAGYLSQNPYHNATHAADVAYTTHCMLRRGVADALGLTKLQCAVAVLAAAAHDFRHPGIGAPFLIAMGDELALTYNDRSPLESYHTSEFFKLLKANKQLDLFCQLERKEAQDVRKSIITMIMATDMSVHFDYLDKFIKRFPPREPGAEPGPPADVSVDDQNFAMAMLLHCADISNPAKPQAAYTEWTDRVLAEFYHQGDKEAANGLPVSTFYDRAKPSVSKMQTGFIGYIVKPIFSAWCDFVPELKDMCLPQLEANAELWKGDSALVPPEQSFVHADRADWDWQQGRWR